MLTPFPGMDPYLEGRGVWGQVHTRLIVAIADALTPVIKPKYLVDIEQRVYLDTPFQTNGDDLIGEPDASITIEPQVKLVREASTVYGNVLPLIAYLPTPEERKERYLVIRDATEGDVITAIELLSPSNKRAGQGRKEYLIKREKVLASQTHFVEIDLIRGGRPMPMQLKNGGMGDYRILISREQHRPRADVYAFTMRQPIPDFPIPLQPQGPEPTLPLNQLLRDVYDRAAFDLKIDYRQPLEPPLAQEDQEWVETLIKKISQTP